MVALTQEALEEGISRSRGGALYDDGEHQFIWLGLDETEGGKAVQINQYVVRHGSRAAILDPGGAYTYAMVVANLSRYLSLDQVDTLFFSHQDPDVSSGIGLWLNTTSAKVYISRLWTSFLPHFGGVDPERIVGIPDQGQRLELGAGAHLELIPAHFLHSIGNFCVYDPRAKILFSGDIGSSVFSPGSHEVFVDELAGHLPRMEGFHRRYMSCNRACRLWAERVARLEVRMICPQHGAILRGAAVGQFLDWFRELSCGVDRLEELYG